MVSTIQNSTEKKQSQKKKFKTYSSILKCDKNCLRCISYDMIGNAHNNILMSRYLI